MSEPSSSPIEAKQRGKTSQQARTRGENKEKTYNHESKKVS